MMVVVVAVGNMVVVVAVGNMVVVVAVGNMVVVVKKSPCCRGPSITGSSIFNDV